MSRYATHGPGQPAPAPTLPPILPQASHMSDQLALPENPPAFRAAGRREGHILQRGRRWIVAGGAVAAGIPAGPGLIWALERRPGALLLLVLAGVVVLSAGILNTAAVMYQAQQETRRKEVECRAADTLAAALARCIDDAHTRAQNLSGREEMEEAARVRASARQLLTEVVPPVAALLGQAREHPSDPAQDRRRGCQKI